MLRAYQMRQFIKELQRWTDGAAESDELTALGGDFVDTLQRNRWCSGGRRLLLGERELRVLFKKRWNAITGLHGPTFNLSIDENKVRFAFLLRHPFRAQRNARDGSKLATSQRSRAQLAVIDKLVALDPNYPAELARGVVMFQRGRYALASERFRRHLAARPDGPHTLRARNYLKASLDRALDGTL